MRWKIKIIKLVHREAIELSKILCSTPMLFFKHITLVPLNIHIYIYSHFLTLLLLIDTYMYINIIINICITSLLTRLITIIYNLCKYIIRICVPTYN